MVTLLKLGGSLITDKRSVANYRTEVMDRLAQEIRQALDQAQQFPLIIGHGSGSFGHQEAKKFNTIAGVSSPDEWRGFASVATVAAELNYLVAKSLMRAGLPVFRIQPSASAEATGGVIQTMALGPIIVSLAHGIIPLVYGDVVIDKELGGTIISTETIFAYLVHHLDVKRILLLGEVPGVMDHEQRIIERIDSTNISEIEHVLRGSDGVDVTGGMITKVRDMLRLASLRKDMEIQILSGAEPGLLTSTLLGHSNPGTAIYG